MIPLKDRLHWIETTLPRAGSFPKGRSKAPKQGWAPNHLDTTPKTVSSIRLP